MKPSKDSRQLLLDLPFHKEYTAESLIIGGSNKMAIDFIKDWPDSPSNFIAIIGEAGCGKTHLGHVWRDKSNALWIDSDVLPDLEQIHAAHHIVIDDADQIQNEAWLFHTYNIIKECGGRFLMLTKSSPSSWPTKLLDLKSRLGTFMCINVTLPDDNMVKSLLIKLFYERALRPSPEVIDYLAKRISRSYKDLLDTVATIDHYALQHHKELTVPVVKIAIETMLS